MKTNREQILDLIQSHSASSGGEGVSTQYLADELGIQRTNVSSILNELVAEGAIGKRQGRPVLYYAWQESAESAAFKNLIGWNGSLRRAVQLAKAAALYPQRSLDILISGESGTGKSFLAQVIHRFTVESDVLPSDVPILIFNCRDYQGDEARALRAFFGVGKKQGLFQSGPGVLLIDNAHLLSIRLRSLICDKLDPAKRLPEEARTGEPMVIVTCDSANRELIAEFERRLPVSIALPTLAQRPMQERLELVERFFTLEAARAKRRITVEGELLRSLLLYDCPINLTQLKGDVKLGCANAYVRERGSSKPLHLYMSDFSGAIRKGFLNYGKLRDEVESIVPAGYTFTFDQDTVEMTPMDREKLDDASIYDDMDRRFRELSGMGLEEEDIGAAMNATVSAMFERYRRAVMSQVVNREQLSRLVDERVINLVEEFVETIQIKTGQTLPPSAVYGLCLHIQGLLDGRPRDQRFSGDKLKLVMEQNRAEYTLALQLAARAAEELALYLPTDEIIFLTLFIASQPEADTASTGPTLLFLYHGDALATALARTVETITHSGNVFACDVPFEQSDHDIYATVKAAVERADRGGGVLALYDMSTLGNMLRVAASETGIEVRWVRFPITNLGIEWARHAGSNGGLNSLHKTVLASLTDLRRPMWRVIVTLCATGVGGAEQIKHYVEQYGALDDDMKVIPLGFSDPELLREMLLQVMENGVIQCLIGPVNPHIMDLPFVPLTDLFGAPTDKVPSIIRLKKQERGRIDFAEVYRYLEENLEHTDVGKLKELLPTAISQINTELTELALDTEIGLFLHLACSVNRMLGKDPQPKNMNREAIIKANADDYKGLRRALKPLELGFGVIFSDDEIATIISIIRRT
ncbi:MAG TPA: PRD domain-containing protein [Pseudoflavonifractor sp.]|nr:PRD domain-containing protein [Pseudoflavonifractor sp.]